MDVDIKIREDGEISWLKSHEQFKNKNSFNEDNIGLYKELLGYTTQDVDTLVD
jgi:hypothetical protein